MQRSSIAPSPADFAACRSLLRGGSRSFHAAARLLPPATRDDATSLYAFCRVADDAIDSAGPGDSDAALEMLRERLRLAYAGTPRPIPADRTFAHVVALHAIPAALPDALLEGFTWDVQGRQYDDLSGLYAYATRVAGTVGAMMALLMGVRRPAALARAIDLGCAMQLTNIARDVGEDARAGRLYLPRAWLRDAGIDPDAWLARPTHSPALAAVIQRLLDTAETLYVRASAGIAALPARCRPGIRAARLLYAEIGREVERNECDSVSQRAVVSARRKAALLMRAAARSASTVPGLMAPGLVAPGLVEMDSPPALAEAQYLIDAVAAAHHDGTLVRDRSFAGQVAWIVDLFARLDQQAPSRHAAWSASVNTR